LNHNLDVILYITVRGAKAPIKMNLDSKGTMSVVRL